VSIPRRLAIAKQQSGDVSRPGLNNPFFNKVILINY